MTKTKYGLVYALFYTIFCLALAGPAIGQSSSTKVEDSRISIEMKCQPLGKIISYLMTTYDIPFGFEQSTLDRHHSEYEFDTNMPVSAAMKRRNDDVELEIEFEREFAAKDHAITVVVQNGPLSAALTQIVSQMQNYKWESNEGVINIVPVRGRDQRFAELLESRVEKFRLESDNTVDDITKRILGLKAFSGWLLKNNLHFNPARTGPSILIEAQYGRRLNVNLEFSNLTFRELLNRITLSKRGGWVLKWFSVARNGGELIYLDI